MLCPLTRWYTSALTQGSRGIPARTHEAAHGPKAENLELLIEVFSFYPLESAS